MRIKDSKWLFYVNIMWNVKYSHPNVTSSEQIGGGERVQEASSIKTQNQRMQQNLKQFYGLYPMKLHVGCSYLFKQQKGWGTMTRILLIWEEETRNWTRVKLLTSSGSEFCQHQPLQKLFHNIYLMSKHFSENTFSEVSENVCNLLCVACQDTSTG